MKFTWVRTWGFGAWAFWLVWVATVCVWFVAFWFCCFVGLVLVFGGCVCLTRCGLHLGVVGCGLLCLNGGLRVGFVGGLYACGCLCLLVGWCLLLGVCLGFVIGGCFIANVLGIFDFWFRVGLRALSFGLGFAMVFCVLLWV